MVVVCFRRLDGFSQSLLPGPFALGPPRTATGLPCRPGTGTRDRRWPDRWNALFTRRPGFRVDSLGLEITGRTRSCSLLRLRPGFT